MNTYCISSLFLLQVLEQACAKQKLDPNMHALK